MFALETDLPRDPLLLASRLWGQPGPMILWSADGSGPSYVSCWPNAESRATDPEPALPLFRSPASRAKERASLWDTVPRWVGLLPYEAERWRWERPGWSRPETRPDPHHLEPHWWRYPAMAMVERRVTIVGEDWASVRALHELLTRAPAALGRLRLVPGYRTEAPAAHERRVRRALHWIREGDIYQVNVARRLEFRCEGSTLELLRKMSRQARAPFCCAVEAAGVASTSPELFLKTSVSGRVLTRPIKGTRPRARDAVRDAAEQIALATDPKEHAELSMVIDIERSDLARVSRVGSVCALPAVTHAHSRIFHREASVSAQLLPSTTRAELLAATLPSGSITGAPKVRAMELIAELEPQRRGLYTGALGFITHAGGLNLAMAIRTMTCREGAGHYFVGGGIVADSIPEREVLETEWKSVQVTALAQHVRPSKLAPLRPAR